ncbi:MAG: AEC family transporter [Clostridiales bacterium]|nr:AEC family transporter [Clostridiales bacterium]
MLESFIYSLNIVAPIFVIVLLGAILKRVKFINENFISICDKLVFKICLPCLLFQDIATAESTGGGNVRLIIFCVVAVTLSFLLPCIFVPIFIKDNAKRGAFIQGVYRSNSAILGVTLASSMFGAEGRSTIAMVLSFVVTLFNVFAVIILSFYAPADVKLSRKDLFRKIAKTIATNPLIIAILLALVWRLTTLELPMIADRSLTYLADMSMPLALISLGANFTFESLRGRVGLAIVSSSLKTIVLPALTVISAMLLGFRGVELGVVFIIFGGPAAVSSYIMAKQMKSDYELASQILLISTLMSLVTLFAGIFILRATGLI